MPNMKRWSDVKLDKEVIFAALADDYGSECTAWNKKLNDECQRRSLKGTIPESGSNV